LLLALAPVALGGVPPYPVVELQARSNIVDGYNLPALSSFNSKTPALNDAATIAFTLIYVAGGDPGLFVGSAGTGSVVYFGPFEHGLSDPSINTDGDVAFDQSDIFSEGIYLYDASSGNTTQAIPPVTFSFANGPTITDVGRIGFRAGQLGGAQSWQLYDDGTPSIYVAETGNVAFLFGVETNNSHEMAGKVRLNSTSESAPDEIRLYDGPGSFVVIADDVDADALSPYQSFDNSVSLTNDGRAAFIADLVGGGRGVFLGDETTTITIATLDDPRVSTISFFPPAANSSGLVAFRGTDGDGLDAIFVGDGNELVRLIGEHDLVETDLGTARIDQHDGSVVFGGAPAINESGDVAFNAALTPQSNDQIEWGSGMFVALTESLPPPVPDGIVGTPMTIGKAALGGNLVIRWDVTTCPADDYNLFSGDLALVSSLVISTADCSLGATGAVVVSPSAGSAFFLLAAENAGGVESGHGLDGNGDPRSSNAVGLCGISAQSLDGSCP
jgi:hypothetical protein